MFLWVQKFAKKTIEGEELSPTALNFLDTSLLGKSIFLHNIDTFFSDIASRLSNVRILSVRNEPVIYHAAYINIDIYFTI
jgi:hypothetical protein